MITILFLIMMCCLLPFVILTDVIFALVLVGCCIGALVLVPYHLIRWCSQPRREKLFRDIYDDSDPSVKEPEFKKEDKGGLQ